MLLMSLLAAGCGGPSREPGFEPGELLDWTLSDTVRTDTGCTDAKKWMDAFAGFHFSRRVVQVSETGSTAQLLLCTSYSVVTCAPTDPPITLSVEGGTMQYTGSRAVSISGAPDCLLGLTEDLRITDHGHQMRETVRYQLDLLGDRSQCEAVEADAVATGSNGLGLSGCRITFESDGRL